MPARLPRDAVKGPEKRKNVVPINGGSLPRVTDFRSQFLRFWKVQAALPSHRRVKYLYQDDWTMRVVIERRTRNARTNGI